MASRLMQKIFPLLALLALSHCAESKPTVKSVRNTNLKKNLARNIKGDGDAKRVFGEADAVAFMVEQCGGCHSPGMPLALTWEMPEEKDLSAASLGAMESSSNVYQTMVHRFKNVPVGQQPTPMPPSLAEEKMEQLGELLNWYRENVPTAVAGAESIYGGASQFGSEVPINLTYQCGQIVRGRDFINRLYLAAIGRPPTSAEINKIPVAELDQPVTDARRSELTAAIFKDPQLKKEFLTNPGGGLRLLAQRISNAGAITAAPKNFGLNQAAADDLKQEFYQMLLKYVEGKSYKDILLMPKVQVSANTAPLYSLNGDGPCTAPPAETWSECDLSAKRGNFFGTVAYLNSTNTSFLNNNNNYRRGGTIFAVIAGQSLMAQTNGPKGQKPDPVPDCVTTKDVRMVADDDKQLDGAKAPRGAMAIPRSGAICQGCHLYKYLNVASYVFRPFDDFGLLYPASAFNKPQNGQADNNPYKDMLKTATALGIVNGADITGPAQQVDAAFLKSLFDENNTLGAQCIKDRSGKKIADISNIGDLVKFMVGDGKVLVNGLSRYFPKVLLNLSTTNQEIVTAVASAYTKDNGMLLPMVEAFFNTQTFACAASSGN